MLRTISNSQKTLLRIKTFSIPFTQKVSKKSSNDLRPSKPLTSSKSPTYSPSATQSTSSFSKSIFSDSISKQISSKVSKSPTFLHPNPLFTSPENVKPNQTSKKTSTSKKRNLIPNLSMIRLRKKTRKFLNFKKPRQNSREIFKNWDLNESYKIFKPSKKRFSFLRRDSQRINLTINH
jgi:hypothetical protein